jgi:tubulysin polyketide synthase-like protein
MSALDLFLHLTAAGCQLTRVDDRLRVHDPQHALTEALRQAIREHKAALLALLAQSAPAHAAAIAPSPQEACTHQEHVFLPPPPYPGSPVGAPFRPGHQVWLYRWDDQTPQFDAPVTIVQMRTLWPGEQDIGWCNAAGEVTWHNARLAVAVERSQAC